MRQIVTIACLTAVGVLMLVPASGREGTDRPWDGGVIPDWALRQTAPIVSVGDAMDFDGLTASSDCLPSIEFDVTREIIAPHYDPIGGVTEVYVRDGWNYRVIRHDIDSALNHTETPIAVDAGVVWLAEDLDCDGEIELIGQHGADLSIYSSPDWTLRQQFYWEGMYVEMNPAVVNIDDDRFLEIFVTPHTLGATGRAVIIKYDSLSGTFAKISDIAAPDGVMGRPAVGDFDEDGRMEFIVANNPAYGLYEWQGSSLAYVGSVGGPNLGNDFCAAAVRPRPDGVLCALLGHSSPAVEGEYRYDLIAATGDNVFETVHVFSELTGYTGIQPCLGADVDCDGLDELVMLMSPLAKIYEWDIFQGLFTQGCSWHGDIYGGMGWWYTVDLDQNGAPEWGTVNHADLFRAFPDPDCINCDSAGVCTPPSTECYCFCLSDPICDGVSNVLDVVTAVDVAFRSAASEGDPFPQCPYNRTDTDCDGKTDVLDVVHLVNVTFRGSSPAIEFSDPCP